MPDPRSTTTHRLGTEPRRPLTFKADGTDIVFDAAQPGGSSVVGRAVMISANGTVRLTADAGAVDGKLVKVEADGYCHVQTEGVVDLPSSGTIAAGNKVVGALTGAARGYVRGAVATVLAEVAVARHKVIDATTAASVEIILDG